MNRRSFLKSTVLAAAVLAVPGIALPKRTVIDLNPHGYRSSEVYNEETINRLRRHARRTGDNVSFNLDTGVYTISKSIMIPGSMTWTGNIWLYRTDA